MVNREPSPTLSGYPVELLRQWLKASCAAQGVPEVVRDPRVLADVAVLLRGAGAGMRGAARGSR